MLAVALAHAVTPPAPDSVLNPPDRPVAIRLDAELGFVAPLAHTVQFGRSGTTFDYVDDGGQDLLFPFARFAGAVDVGRSSLVLLYQPLDLRTEVVLDEPLVVDTVTFDAGTAVDLRYGFSFWRASWLWDALPAPRPELALGLGLQLRDADLVFTATDGSTRFAERDVGPVPLLAARTRVPLGEGAWLGAEASGIYAPIKYLNGADVDVEGALLDASVRLGVARRQGVDTSVALRYLGGGAAGQSKDPEALGDGYSENWLHTATVSVGVGVR